MSVIVSGEDKACAREVVANESSNCHLLTSEGAFPICNLVLTHLTSFNFLNCNQLSTVNPVRESVSPLPEDAFTFFVVLSVDYKFISHLTSFNPLNEMQPVDITSLALTCSPCECNVFRMDVFPYIKTQSQYSDSL